MVSRPRHQNCKIRTLIYCIYNGNKNLSLPDTWMPQSFEKCFEPFRVRITDCLKSCGIRVNYRFGLSTDFFKGNCNIQNLICFPILLTLQYSRKGLNFWCPQISISQNILDSFVIFFLSVAALGKNCGLNVVDYVNIKIFGWMFFPVLVGD